ncbi:MAG: DUF554 domain-containing protein [Coriobacteriia bacterium]|nr:DUF554 domain-containing protein [Coriobacteriia bacterium]
MSGVVLNVITVLIGTTIGVALGRLVTERFRKIAFIGIGLSTMSLGAMMAIRGLESMSASAMGDYAILIFIGALISGSILGEAVGIERWLERFGSWLQETTTTATATKVAKPPSLAEKPASASGQRPRMVEGFVTASLLFCVGSMTILGSIQDGLGNHQLLYAKSMLDGVAALFFSSVLGVGVGFAIIPIIVIQGGLALGAHALSPIMTSAVIDSITAVGGALIFAIGLDNAGIKRLPVGNMVPAIIVAAVLGGIFG